MELMQKEANLDDDSISKIAESILIEARRRKGEDPVRKIIGVQVDVSEKITEIVANIRQ